MEVLSQMKILRRLVILALVFGSLMGCGGRSERHELATPTAGVNIVYFVGKGAPGLAPNGSDLYIELGPDGQTDRQLVLAGTYLDIESVVWRDRGFATICLKGGYTSEFHNRLALNNYSNRQSYNFHFALREDCTAKATAP